MLFSMGSVEKASFFLCKKLNWQKTSEKSDETSLISIMIMRNLNDDPSLRCGFRLDTFILFSCLATISFFFVLLPFASVTKFDCSEFEP